MFDPREDPLGLGLKQRAREHRQSYAALNPQAAGYMSGPLPDQDWDAFFQAVGESAGGRPVNFAAGAAPNETFEANLQNPDTSIQNLATMHSNQFRGVEPNSLVGPGTHAQNVRHSAIALRRLAGGGRIPGERY